MSLIDVRSLTLGYENRTVLRDLSFCVDEGDYLCIVGENGSGKSTLMKTLLGLQKPLSGTIAFGDGLLTGYCNYTTSGTSWQVPTTASRGPRRNTHG